MSNGTFALLWSKTMQSSIWLESAATRIVWISLLMLKDKNGVVSGGSLAGLAHAANVSLEECTVAIEKFLAPDPQSSTDEFEGRRIERVPGGWRLLNHEKYQFSDDSRRAFWALQKADQRRKQMGKFKKPGKPIKGEVPAIVRFERGEITQEQFDELATKGT